MIRKSRMVLAAPGPLLTVTHRRTVTLAKARLSAGNERLVRLVEAFEDVGPCGHPVLDTSPYPR